MLLHLRCCTIALLLFVLTLSSMAQSPSCQAPVLRTVPLGANLFNDQQEMELAAILHRALEQDAKIIEDEELTSELQSVADRLAKRFPDTGLKFHAYILDSPDTNAFAQPGGNIYFTRKLIALFHNEDELAGVMAHEMGHIVTHQGAIEISRLMRAVLGITQITDIDDVDERYNELLDSYRKKPNAFRSSYSEQQHQIDADQVAVFALGSAGYDVKSLPAWWDKFTENKGKKGNFLTDLFGGTTEERRRFRDMLKNASAMPPSCIAAHPDVNAADFKKWKAAVLTYEGIGHKEKLQGLAARKQLTPPLRAELSRLRVSPDGKYVLAQDNGSIAVFGREDFHLLFRIDVDDAHSAQFSADSKQITFYTLEVFSSPRVEVWDVADHSLRAVYELHIPSGCNQAALSPDSKYFACVFPESDVSALSGVPFDLRVLSTETGEIAYEKKGFFHGDVFSTLTHIINAILAGEEMQVLCMRFTPDSKYLLGGRKESTFAFDAATGAKINLPNSVKDLMKIDFSFLNGDRMIGEGGSKGERGGVVKFPTGEVLYSNLKLGLSHVEGVTKGDYAIVSPMTEVAIGLFDLKKNEFVLGSKKPGFDIYDDEYLSERPNGEIEAILIGPKKERISKALAGGAMGRVVSAAASEDLNYVAISGTARGAVWNVALGVRMQHLRRFDGVGIDDNGFAVADFPKEGEAKRQFVQMNTMTGFATTFPAEEDVYHHESGRYLFDSVPKKKDEWRKNVTWKVRDMRTNKVLWTRDFPNGLPVAFATDDVDSLIFAYDVNDSAGKMELQNNPELRARVQALKTQQHAYGIESVDIRTGKINGIMALDTGKGSFKLRDAFRSGDYIVTSDSNDRVQVFAFDGTRKARLQSHGAAGTRDGSLIAATVGRGKLAIYNLKTAKLLCVQQFSSRIAMFQFSAQADRLLVVTRDQKAYYFDTKMLLAAQVASK